MKNKVLISEIEKDIDNFLRKVPFHNLFLLYGIKVKSSHLGGTCTNRTIYFMEYLENKYGNLIKFNYGIAEINERPTHRILKFEFCKKIYFIDVGVGFPLNKVIPAFKNIKFSAFGIQFSTRKFNDDIIVSSDIKKKGELKVLYKIKVSEDYQMNQEELLSKQQSDFNQVPFRFGIRYMFIQDNTFYMIRHDNKDVFNQNDIGKFANQYSEHNRK